ncbi:uncharacterized protein LOC120336511 [Styela clava]|uniref:uncharacterized protein LOC120336511 n=1 Tax=Styela clava TaxID=7725 RepID=UPI001939D316|nr:uncharacterized protein LOC120336511 [Styela clava]
MIPRMAVFAITNPAEETGIYNLERTETVVYDQKDATTMSEEDFLTVPEWASVIGLLMVMLVFVVVITIVGCLVIKRKRKSESQTITTKENAMNFYENNPNSNYRK